MRDFIRWFDSDTAADVSIVGGKNASLGEMIRTLQNEGVRVPDGFATTSEAYWHFLSENHIVEEIRQELSRIDGSNVVLEQGPATIRLCRVPGPS